MSEITWDEFVENYKPIKNHLDDNASYDGLMFETYGDEVIFAFNHAPAQKVWTIVEHDEEDRRPIIVPGYHLVNRIGYIVTDVPWGDEELIVNDDD